jgi:DNA-directed RNA polymerase specialized sigma24 family protein
MTRDEYGIAFLQGFDRTIAGLMSRGAHYEEARDAAQAAWVKGWERIYQLRDEHCLVAWVGSIAWSLFLSDRRVGAKYTLDRLDSHQQLAAPDWNPDASLDLRGGLQSVSACHRELLDLRMSGYKNREIARMSGRSDGAINSKMTRAHRALRAALLKKNV